MKPVCPWLIPCEEDSYTLPLGREGDWCHYDELPTDCNGDEVKCESNSKKLTGKDAR